MREDNDGEEEGNAHEDGAVKKSTPVERTTTQTTVFESFKDGSEGVESDDVAVFLRCCREGIDDWSGIHEELDAKLNQELHVTVFGGHGGDDKSPRHAMHGNQED